MEIYIFKLEEMKIIEKEEYMWRWFFNSNWIWKNNILRTIGNEYYGKYSYFCWDVNNDM